MVTKTDFENKISFNEESFPSLIEAEKEYLIKKLNEDYLPKLVSNSSNNELSKILTNYSDNLDRYLGEFEKDYTFIRPKSLMYRVNRDQLKMFSPKDIITPIVLDKLEDKTQKISIDFNDKVARLNSTLLGLGRIIEYNLDSAIIKSSEDNSNVKEGISVAKDGLLRAIGKTEDYHESLNSHLNDVVLETEKSISTVLDDLMDLSNIDRLITLKIQVSKEKTVAELKSNFQKYYQRFFTKRLGI